MSESVARTVRRVLHTGLDDRPVHYSSVEISDTWLTYICANCRLYFGWPGMHASRQFDPALAQFLAFRTWFRTCPWLGASFLLCLAIGSIFVLQYCCLRRFWLAFGSFLPAEVSVAVKDGFRDFRIFPVVVQ